MTVEECILDAVLVFLIPSNSQKNLPSGRDIFNKNDFLKNTPEWFKEAVSKVNTLAQEGFNKNFSDLTENEQQVLLTNNQRKLTAFLNNLMVPLITQYYTAGAALKGIGYGDRAPFPDGHEILEGDFTLLEDVYSRGQIYKNTPT